LTLGKLLVDLKNDFVAHFEGMNEQTVRGKFNDYVKTLGVSKTRKNEVIRLAENEQIWLKSFEAKVITNIHQALQMIKDEKDGNLVLDEDGILEKSESENVPDNSEVEMTVETKLKKAVAAMKNLDKLGLLTTQIQVELEAQIKKEIDTNFSWTKETAKAA
jgi:hypothetical protein